MAVSRESELALCRVYCMFDLSAVIVSHTVLVMLSGLPRTTRLSTSSKYNDAALDARLVKEVKLDLVQVHCCQDLQETSTYPSVDSGILSSAIFETLLHAGYHS